MIWHIWTDGSAITDEHTRSGSRFPGGWAAVVEHGSDGYVVRGREPETTNVRMELRAAIEGLREVPSGEQARLNFDCTAILSVANRREQNQLNPMQAKQLRDGDLWLALASEFDRVDVELRLLGKGHHPIHRRAHTIAQAEAKALAAHLPAHAVVLSKPERKEMRRTAVAEAMRERARKEMRYHGLRHAQDCSPVNCVASCDVWLHFGYPVAGA